MLTRTRTIITCAAAATAVGLGASMAAPAMAARLAPGSAAGFGGALRLPSRDHAIGRVPGRPVNTRSE